MSTKNNKISTSHFSSYTKTGGPDNGGTKVVQASSENLTVDDTEKSRPGRSRHDKKYYILLFLFLMFLIFAQALIVLGNTGVHETPEALPVSSSSVTADDITDVKNDLREVRQSLVELAEEQEEETIPVDHSSADNPVSTAAGKTSTPSVNQEASQTSTTPVAKSAVSPVATPVAGQLTLIKPKQTEQAVKQEPVAEQVADSGYIKIDTTGDALDDTADQWTCVLDKSTGLMWEVKSDDDNLRSSKSLFTWYQPTHGDLSGVSDGGRCTGGINCDTHAYVEAMNKIKYCGHDDWQLPTREQMQTLVELGNSKDKVKIDRHYFPRALPSWYWTASQKEEDDELAWYVLFRNGFALSDLKERPKHVRLVRQLKSASDVNHNI
jgi:cytoskeletal protein RodZ